MKKLNYVLKFISKEEYYQVRHIVAQEEMGEVRVDQVDQVGQGMDNLDQLMERVEQDQDFQQMYLQQRKQVVQLLEKIYDLEEERDVLNERINLLIDSQHNKLHDIISKDSSEEYSIVNTNQFLKAKEMGASQWTFGNKDNKALKINDNLNILLSVSNKNQEDSLLNSLSNIFNSFKKSFQNKMNSQIFPIEKFHEFWEKILKISENLTQFMKPQERQNYSYLKTQYEIFLTQQKMMYENISGQIKEFDNIIKHTPSKFKENFSPNFITQLNDTCQETPERHPRSNQDHTQKYQYLKQTQYAWSNCKIKFY